MEERIIEKRKESAETLRSFFEENEERLRDTLTAHVITDSLGRHKDRRNALRERQPAMLPEPPAKEAEQPEEYTIEINENDFLNDF